MSVLRPEPVTDTMQILDRAESNPLIAAGYKLAAHARRLQRLDVGSVSDHDDLLRIVADVDTILLGIHGDNADWQDYRARYEDAG